MTDRQFKQARCVSGSPDRTRAITVPYIQQGHPRSMNLAASSFSRLAGFSVTGSCRWCKKRPSPPRKVSVFASSCRDKMETTPSSILIQGVSKPSE